VASSSTRSPATARASSATLCAAPALLIMHWSSQCYARCFAINDLVGTSAMLVMRSYVGAHLVA